MKEEIIGKRFTRLIVKEISQTPFRGRSALVCVCDCGVERLALAKDLRKGRLKSCGCLRKDNALSVQKLYSPKTPIKHGMRRTRQYTIWQNMKKRCDSSRASKYERYGGRGITYDPKWSTFEGFWNDMSKGYRDNLTIDRIDNNGNYCKENCRWATFKQQARNRQSNHTITHDGKTLTIQEWAEELGVPRNRLQNRVNQNWDAQKILVSHKYPHNNNSGCLYLSK